MIRSIIRTGETYGDDHYSQIEATFIFLAAGEWIGPAVRVQNSDQDFYSVIYFNDQNSNTYVLQLYKRISGTFTEIDPFTIGTSGYTLNGPLAPGDQIKLSISGSTLSVLLNGYRVIKLVDSSIPSGGSPGIISYGAATAQNWAADSAKPELVTNIQTFTTAPPNSANNGGGHSINVLTPTLSAVPVGVPHNFLYVLPVDSDGVYSYGNGLDTLYGLNIHNEYNLTIIQPAFAIGSWNANHTTDPTLQHETFMASDLPPWVTSNYSITGNEKHWLLGFSRSGFGWMGLLLKYPTVFDRGAFWDWPFDMTTSN
jgi:hypothetical protein